MGVLTTGVIEEGTLFGPIPPTLSLTDPVLMIGHMTADQRPDVHTVKLDINKLSKGPGLVEWVPYVRAAHDSSEQNLEAFLLDGHLFYRTTKHVNSDQELFVWYTPELARTVGVPEIHPAFIQGGSTFICPYCCKEFIFPYSLRAHMRFKCERNPYLQKIESKQMTSPKLQTDNIQNKTEFLANNVSPPDSLKSNSPPEYRERGEKRKLEIDFDIENKNDKISKKLDIDSELSPKRGNVSPKLSLSPGMNDLSPIGRKTSFQEEREESLSAFTKVEKLLHSSEQLSQSTTSSGSLPIYGHPLVSHPVLGQTSIPAAHPILSASSIPVRPSQIDQLTRMMAPPMHAMSRSHPVAMALKENIPVSIANMARQPIKNTADLRNLINAGKLPFHPDWRFHFPFYRSQNPIVETILQSATNGITSPFPPQLNLAQNWCAKCNATFRMTSDLVYHMRSHHKGEAEVAKKKPEKLKCDVCGETFRERHHLTRHMTSHQEA